MKELSPLSPELEVLIAKMEQRLAIKLGAVTIVTIFVAALMLSVLHLL